MTWYHLEYNGDLEGVLELRSDYTLCSQDEDELWSEVSIIVNNFVDSMSLSDIQDYIQNECDEEDDEDEEESPKSPRSIMWGIIEDDMRVVKGFVFSKEFENLDTYDGF